MLLHAVLALEAFDPARRIDQALLPGKERMALRADFDMDLRERRTGLKSVAACACDHAASVIGMDFSFHCLFQPVELIC